MDVSPHLQLSGEVELGGGFETELLGEDDPKQNNMADTIYNVPYAGPCYEKSF